jgi:phenylacetate-CoA ligase
MSHASPPVGDRDHVSVWQLLREARRVRSQGRAAIEQRQRARLAEMVAYARAHSPYYHKLYQHLPERVEDSTRLPVTSKETLMACFDDWITDREVTIEQVRAFVADPNLIGERFRGKYLVATTSGTSGRRGIFLLDDRNMAVQYALSSLMSLSWLSACDLIPILGHFGRSAMVMATGGHFIGVASIARIRKTSWWNRKTMRVFSVYTPLPELVTELNRFRPALLFGYASVIALLAREQEAGRLRLDRVQVQAAGETLAESEYDRIAKAFHAKVHIAYTATECLFISASCEQGWQHVNLDWVVLEPVDADYRPVPPGEPSHTVLISNLANRVQPIVRYDLGDSILVRPDLCPCGNPLPAIRIQGRVADVLTFPTSRGEQVAIAPLALGTPLDGIAGIEQFQLVQTTPTSLRVRLRLAPLADADRVWQQVHAEITYLLTEHQVGHITLERAKEPPQQSPGGKYRTIIPLS